MTVDNSRLTVFELKVAGTPMGVVRMAGREALSSLFEFHVEVADLDLDPETLLGQPALLEIRALDAPRLVQGIVTEAEYVGQTRSHQLYELTIAPLAHRLALREGCRVFQNKTTEQIVTDVLVAAGIPRDFFAFNLTAEYGPRNYCVQYRETDLAFVHRLLEEDGIFYYFKHEEARHVWLMADHVQAHQPIDGTPTVDYNPPTGAVQDREHVHEFRFGGRLRPGKLSLRDFNLHRPDLGLEAQEAARTNTDLEVYEFPGEYQEPGRGGPHQGQFLAKTRLEELQSHRRFGSGVSDCPRLSAGRTMTLAGHPKHELNAEYRIIQVEHTGSQPQTLGQDESGASEYRNRFTVTELRLPFRPARQTPRPVMRGVQTATVVGPEGEEVHTDAEGRVRVQFHWDREGLHNETSTTWVRVSQAWAGNGYGSMFLPRIGHEVLVDFIEGDPDRPIVIGRIYHGGNDTPYPLPAEKTKSTIKSDSSPGGGGFNELRFEDRKGSEEIFLHAQKDWNTQILNNMTESVGVDCTETIGSNLTTSVGSNRTTTIGSNDSCLVGAVHSVTIAQPSTPPPSVPATGTTMQDTFYKVTSGAARIVLNGPDVFIIAEGSVAVSATANITLAAGGNISVLATEQLILNGKLVKINC
ncbi:type VI secretion system Vgr family protein [Nannocystis bainbridge]|uniref:Type VI secretion system tip protein VgrG n=1 Tax=Nannocystis bainbridge TaxID=2995303 RepID=A0ABT5DT05_9BACT|nr:type VI secretion system tip protein VgrG [Nannocystis bainbridge]MDC0716774.1 type VI secretion system tip protein VgrG [Nannocystis bainbridge]